MNKLKEFAIRLKLLSPKVDRKHLLLLPISVLLVLIVLNNFKTGSTNGATCPGISKRTNNKYREAGKEGVEYMVTTKVAYNSGSVYLFQKSADGWEQHIYELVRFNKNGSKCDEEILFKDQFIYINYSTEVYQGIWKGPDGKDYLFGIAYNGGHRALIRINLEQPGELLNISNWGWVGDVIVFPQELSKNANLNYVEQISTSDKHHIITWINDRAYYVTARVGERLGYKELSELSIKENPSGFLRNYFFSLDSSSVILKPDERVFIVYGLGQANVADNFASIKAVKVSDTSELGGDEDLVVGHSKSDLRTDIFLTSKQEVGPLALYLKGEQDDSQIDDLQNFSLKGD